MGQTRCIDGQPEAFVAESDALYAATHGAIFTSADEGKTWRLFYLEQGQEDEGAPSQGGTP